MTGGTIGTSGEVRVEADATNVAFANAPGVSVGLVALSVMLPTRERLRPHDGTAERHDHELVEGARARVAENRAKAVA